MFHSKGDLLEVKVTQTPPIILKKRLHALSMTEGQLISGPATPSFSGWDRKVRSYTRMI